MRFLLLLGLLISLLLLVTTTLVRHKRGDDPQPLYWLTLSTYEQNRPNSSNGTVDVFLWQPETNLSRHLLSYLGDVRGGGPVRWTPDGEWLWFYARPSAGEPSILHIRNYRSPQIRTIYTDEGNLSRAVFQSIWSPDGQWAIFDGWDENIDMVFNLVQADGTELTTYYTHIYWSNGRFLSSWSLDSSGFAAAVEDEADNWHIFYSGINDTELSEIALLQNVANISISADADKVAIVTATRTESQLLVMNNDGSNLHEVPKLGNEQYFYAWWTLDNSVIVLTDEVAGNDTLIVALEIDLTEQATTRTVLQDFTTPYKTITWSPDYRNIAVSSVDGPIHVYQLDQSEWWAMPRRNGCGKTYSISHIWSYDSNSLLYLHQDGDICSVGWIEVGTDRQTELFQVNTNTIQNDHQWYYFATSNPEWLIRYEDDAPGYLVEKLLMNARTGELTVIPDGDIYGWRTIPVKRTRFGVLIFASSLIVLTTLLGLAFSGQLGKEDLRSWSW